jgi:hypothetical protein
VLAGATGRSSSTSRSTASCRVAECLPLPVLQRSAAVVYDSADGVSAAMKQGSSGQLVQFELPLSEGPVGLKAWVAAHKLARPGNVELQKQVPKYLRAVDYGAIWCMASAHTHVACCMYRYTLTVRRHTGIVYTSRGAAPSWDCVLCCVLRSCLCVVQLD